ncbi:hypothetical protein RJ639_019856 [Escallonia herrerae]|uniref:cAMP-regulated phosphoprotein 19-related protein n=1 Tax=Escallonia herrerae TaxID=1293975 RepID=A0AA88V775_9ASTE|nr:hypothetical protein RJ639_019856 [Escallonia herrerae]
MKRMARYGFGNYKYFDRTSGGAEFGGGQFPSTMWILSKLYGVGLSLQTRTTVRRVVQGLLHMEGGKEREQVDGKKEEEVIKKKYGGIVPKKPPLISKDSERAYFDSADWALGKQGVEKPKGPLEALRPKLQHCSRRHHVPGHQLCHFDAKGKGNGSLSLAPEAEASKASKKKHKLLPSLEDMPAAPLSTLSVWPTQQQTRYRKSPCAPTDGEGFRFYPSIPVMRYVFVSSGFVSLSVAPVRRQKAWR